MRYRVLPYRQGSKSAKALADALGGKVLKLQRSEPFNPRTRPLRPTTVINWGATSFDGVLMGMCHILNEDTAIRQASNKKLFFQSMVNNGHEAIIPRFWTSQGDIPDDAFPIVCRTVLAGHSGDGIVIANSRSELVSAPLYVAYVKKSEEYRVHVGKRGDGSIDVISLQRKARRHDCPNPNWQIRNHSNGFVFVRNDVSPPASVCAVAKEALSSTLLDFGGIDVIYNSHQQRALVLEINTAVGLEGQTVTDYVNFFRSLT